MSNTLERVDIYKLLEQINDYGNTISDRTCSLPTDDPQHRKVLRIIVESWLLEHTSIKPQGQP